MRVLAIAALMALFAACAAPGAGAPASLDGEWIHASRALRPPTIIFADSGASGFAGCNRWFGQAARDGAGLRFSAVGATRMACEPPMMTIESNFLGVLERTRAARIDGDTLVLLDETGAELATFLRAR